MSDHDPFLAAICESPDDDLPRLIYADYLDERGEGERAEFIRVQCALARRAREIESRITRPALPPGAYIKVDDVRTETELLRARERELLGIVQDGISNWHRWAETAASLLSGIGADHYRRGFVTTLQCTITDWLGQRHSPVSGQCRGQAILKSNPVERVELDGATWMRIAHSDAGWSLRVIYSGNEDGPGDSAVFATRAALIDAMPRQLRMWNLPPTVINGTPVVWVDHLEIDANHPLYRER